MNCSIDSCTKPAKGRGFCGTHWWRWRVYGDPEVLKQPKGVDPEVRFWARVDNDSECLIWTKHLNHNGYGLFWDSNKTVSVHRYSYMLTYGDIPHGLVIDHLCRNRACVNPAHLEAVTLSENVLRGNRNGYHLKTHCKHGHEFNKENTSFRITGGRRCRKCEAIKMAEKRKTVKNMEGRNQI